MAKVPDMRRFGASRAYLERVAALCETYEPDAARALLLDTRALLAKADRYSAEQAERMRALATNQPPRGPAYAYMVEQSHPDMPELATTTRGPMSLAELAELLGAKPSSLAVSLSRGGGRIVRQRSAPIPGARKRWGKAPGTLQLVTVRRVPAKSGTEHAAQTEPEQNV